MDANTLDTCALHYSALASLQLMALVADENEMLWIYLFGARGAYVYVMLYIALFEVTQSIETL